MLELTGIDMLLCWKAEPFTRIIIDFERLHISLGAKNGGTTDFKYLNSCGRCTRRTERIT
jgi:hypothetical protein